MAYEIYRFTWQGIEIEARYAPNKWDLIAHLEIETMSPPRAALPITQTGYLSHFHQIGSIEESGREVVEYVTAWLDAEAAKPDWKACVEASRQGELF